MNHERVDQFKDPSIVNWSCYLCLRDEGRSPINKVPRANGDPNYRDDIRTPSNINVFWTQSSEIHTRSHRVEYYAESELAS